MGDPAAPVSVPPPLPDLRPRPWGFWMTLLLSAAVVVLKIAVDSAVAVAFVIPYVVKHGPESLEAYGEALQNDGFFIAIAIAILISTPVCTALVVLFAYVRKGIGVRDYLALHFPASRSIFVWIGITVVMIIVTDGLRLLLGQPLVPDVSQEWYKTSRIPMLLWFAFIFVAPVVEEVLFRGFMFRGLAASRLGNSGAVLLPALIWALMHLQYNWIDMASIFVLGIVWGIARMRTGSTYTTMVLHAVCNLVATIETAAVVGQTV